MSNHSLSLNTEQDLLVGGFPLNIELQYIQVGDNKVRLRSKLWEVLVYLLENQSRLVSRESLINLFWNGNKLTGEQGVTHTICHLRRIFNYYQIAAKIITIPKRGYVLDDFVETKNKDTLLTALKLNQYEKTPRHYI